MLEFLALTQVDISVTFGYLIYDSDICDCWYLITVFPSFPKGKKKTIWFWMGPKVDKVNFNYGQLQALKDYYIKYSFCVAKIKSPIISRCSNLYTQTSPGKASSHHAITEATTSSRWTSTFPQTIAQKSSPSMLTPCSQRLLSRRNTTFSRYFQK